MVDKPAPCHAASVPANLSQELAQLRPALEGFPVDALVSMYMTAPASDRSATLEVVDRCLLRWIDSLNDSIAALPYSPGDEVLARLQERQTGARDALMRVKSKLGADVIHCNGGQAC